MDLFYVLQLSAVFSQSTLRYIGELIRSTDAFTEEVSPIRVVCVAFEYVEARKARPASSGLVQQEQVGQQ